MARDRLNALGNADGGYRQPTPAYHGTNHDYIPMEQFGNGQRSNGKPHSEQRGRSTSNANRDNGRRFEHSQGYNPRQDQDYSYRQEQGYAQEYSRNQGSGGGGNDGTLDNKFFNLLDKITAQIAELEADIKSVRVMHDRVLTTVKGPQYTHESKKLESFENNIKRKIKETKYHLKELDQYAQGPQEQDLTQSQAIQRKVRKQALTKRLADQINRYYEIQRDFSQRQQAQLKRVYRMMNENATDEEVNNAIKNTTAQELIMSGLTDAKRQEAKRVLSNARERQGQIENIEKSIMQLAEMFQEVSEMVHQQQEQIDNIEAAVEETHIDIQEGIKETDKAIVQRKKSRKKCWWLILLLIILLVIIGVVLYLKLKK